MENKIRLFLRGLFGSRLVERLEEDLLRLRSDMEQRLQDKDVIIATLRAEKAELSGKIVVYENTLLPRSSRAGADLVNSVKPRKPNFGLDFSVPTTLTKWEQVQKEHEEKMAAEADEEAQNKASKQTA
jgi:hypothetical protein